MQTLIQVIATGGRSLRDSVVKDPKLGDYDLVAVEQKRLSRAHGWAKIKSTRGAFGAINIQWDASSRLLICRVVNKREGKPHSIAGDFVDYLLARHKRRIQTIQVVPR